MAECWKGRRPGRIPRARRVDETIRVSRGFGYGRRRTLPEIASALAAESRRHGKLSAQFQTGDRTLDTLWAQVLDIELTEFGTAFCRCELTWNNRHAAFMPELARIWLRRNFLPTSSWIVVCDLLAASDARLNIRNQRKSFCVERRRFGNSQRARMVRTIDLGRCQLSN